MKQMATGSAQNFATVIEAIWEQLVKYTELPVDNLLLRKWKLVYGQKKLPKWEGLQGWPGCSNEPPQIVQSNMRTLPLVEEEEEHKSQCLVGGVLSSILSIFEWCHFYRGE